MNNTTEKIKRVARKEQEKCFVIMPISDQGDSKGHFYKGL